MATAFYRDSHDKPTVARQERVATSARRYPLMLGWLAMASFVAIIVGLFFVTFDPSPLKGLVFPIGLLGIYATRRIALHHL